MAGMLNNNTVSFNKEYYKVDTTFLNIALEKVPLELKENWLYDIDIMSIFYQK